MQVLPAKWLSTGKRLGPPCAAGESRARARGWAGPVRRATPDGGRQLERARAFLMLSICFCTHTHGFPNHTTRNKMSPPLYLSTSSPIYFHAASRISLTSMQRHESHLLRCSVTNLIYFDEATRICSSHNPFTQPKPLFTSSCRWRRHQTLTTRHPIISAGRIMGAN